MKKIVRFVWISLLTGTAFLVACASHNGLTRSQKKQLREERDAITEQIEVNRERASKITEPHELYNMRNEELRLRTRLETIYQELDEAVALDQNKDKQQSLKRELDSLQRVIRHGDIPPCVYGPPR